MAVLFSLSASHPTPKSPLTPRGDFDFLFAAGCFGSGVRSTLQSSTRLRYRSLQSLLMLALCRGKAMGLTILFPMEKSALPKKRTVGSKPPTAFFVQPMLPWGNAPLRLRMGKRGYGDCASPNPATSPKNSWWLRLAWGRLVLTVRTGGVAVAVKKNGKNCKKHLTMYVHYGIIYL